MSIKMIRIDDRLIHGQIVTAWAKNLQIKKIWIADDGVAKDDFIKGVMQMVAPSDRELIITPTSDIPALVDKLDGEADNVLILIKYPYVAKEIFQAGVKLQELEHRRYGRRSRPQEAVQEHLCQPGGKGYAQEHSGHGHRRLFSGDAG